MCVGLEADSEDSVANREGSEPDEIGHAETFLRGIRMTPDRLTPYAPCLGVDKPSLRPL